MATPQASEKLLTSKEAAEFLGVSEFTLRFWRINRKKKAGPQGPEFSRIGYRTIRYSRKDLEAFATSKKPAAE